MRKSQIADIVLVFAMAQPLPINPVCRAYREVIKVKVVNTFLAGIMITAGAAFAMVTMSTTPAQATLAQTGVCPSDLGHSPAGGGGTGSATDCNG
jgi:hypothetical protein